MSEHDCSQCTHAHAPPASRGLAGSLLALVACAFCPACLPLWTGLLGIVGLPLGETFESLHEVVLALSIGLMVAFAARRAWAARSWRPLAIPGAAALLVGSGHVFGIEPLEWMGAALLLASIILDVVRHARPVPVTAAS